MILKKCIGIDFLIKECIRNGFYFRINQEWFYYKNALGLIFYHKNALKWFYYKIHKKGFYCFRNGFYKVYLDFTIKKCIENGFYHKNALEIVFTIKCIWNGFYNKNT